MSAGGILCKHHRSNLRYMTKWFILSSLQLSAQVLDLPVVMDTIIGLFRFSNVLWMACPRRKIPMLLIN